MTGHEEARDLVAVLALDAVDPQERLALEAHVEKCDVCRPELTGYLETIAALVPSEQPPAAVWDRIVARIEHPATPAMANVVPIRSARRLRVRATAVAAAAVAVVAVAGFGAGRWASSGEPSLAAVAGAARTEAGAIVASLQSAEGTSLATVVLLPDGTGYVMDLELPSLPDDRTYQLWEVTQGGVISAGVLGNAPNVASFQAVADVTGFVITDEVAGGVPQSAGRVIATWQT